MRSHPSNTLQNRKLRKNNDVYLLSFGNVFQFQVYKRSFVLIARFLWVTIVVLVLLF